MRISKALRRFIGNTQQFKSVKEMELIRQERIEYLEGSISKRRKEDIQFLSESLISFSIEELMIVREQLYQQNQEFVVGQPLRFDPVLDQVLSDKQDQEL